MTRVFARHSLKGLTLLELVVTLALLAALAALLVPTFSGATDQSRISITKANLAELQTVIMNRYRLDMANLDVLSATPTSEESAVVTLGFPGPQLSQKIPIGREMSPQLAFLFVNPTLILVNPDGTSLYSNKSTFDPLTSRGWNGPYFLTKGATYPSVEPNSDAFNRGFTSAFGEIGDPTVIDGWGHPIVVRLAPVDQNNSVWSLVSAGPDEHLSTSDDMSVYLQ